MIRRFRVWRAYRKLVRNHLNLGYRLSAYNDALYWGQAEESVPR